MFMDQLADMCTEFVVKIRDRDNNGHDFGIREQMLDKGDLHLDAVFAAMGVGVGNGAFVNNQARQFRVDLDLTERGFPRSAVINDGSAAKIPMSGAENDKRIHMLIGLLNGLKCGCRQFTAEHPAGVGDNGCDDGVGKFGL
jgi:hypothetical protein